MPNVITGHTLIAGSRNLVLQFNIVADGTGEYDNYELMNLADYQPPNDIKDWTDLKVLKLCYTTGDGVSFQLKFGSNVAAHRLFFFTPELEDGLKDWSDVGGITSNLNSFDGTIRITTLGFDASADELSVTLWMQKKTKNTPQ